MRGFIIALVAMAYSSFAMAQQIIVVDSEKIFKSIADYTTALERVDETSKSYQSEVDAKFKAVSDAFNEYAALKAGYSASQRQIAEAGILSMESEATKLQESYFAKDGAVMKLRLSLIAPIQERVFKAIEEYAASKGADIVVDRSSNPSILYAGDKADHTEAIIEVLK